MDNGLRVAIWNFYKQDDTIRLFNSQIAYSFLRIPVRNGLSMILDKDDEIQERFFKLEWNEVYDFVEFCMRMRKNSATNRYEHNRLRKDVDELNRILTEEGSVYKVIDGLVVPISNDQEIAEVEEAAESNDYIWKAVELLASRDNLDPKNVIKESISAVEHEVKKTTGEDIVKGLEKLAIHSQLAQAWKNMYNWTSDEPGVRHAKPGRSDVGVAEARYMLVAASAFVNYLKFKGQ